MRRRAEVALGEAGQPNDPFGEPFDAFFSRVYERLYRAMWLATGSRAEADDLAQEAMARALERWDTIGRRGDPTPWVFQVAFNLNRRRFRRAVSKLVLNRLDATDDTSSVDLQTSVLSALSRLPRRQREVLVLVGWLELSAEETARVLGIQAATVRSQLSKGRIALRSQMEETND